MPTPRVLYVENKPGGPSRDQGLIGPAVIERGSFSKTGRSFYYDGKTFRSLNGAGFKANFSDVESGERYWISGPKKNSEDGLYGSRPTPIDQDVRGKYWTLFCKQRDKKSRKTS